MYRIGYDIGSSSVKVALIDVQTGKKVEVLQEPETEMSITAKQPGWAEQDPELWWEYVCTVTKRLLTKREIKPEEISGIGISYQMHGLVIIDDQGQVIRDAIIWCDSRAVNVGQSAFMAIGTEKCEQTLLNSPANFTASKLGWLAQNEPENFKRIAKFMLPGDYIAYRFCGKATTTPSGLSEGVFWNFKDNEVSQDILTHFGIENRQVPEICDTFSQQGIIAAIGAQESGLAVGTPICYRAGDQPNNALSLSIFEPGEVAATGGTSGVMYAVTNSMSVKEYEKVNNFLHVNSSNEHKRIGKLLCINGCGITYRWLKDQLDIDSYEDMNTLAGRIPIGSDGVCVLPFGNGAERMLKNKDIGAHILNLNYNRHTREHLCRAALEGIAFSFVYGMEIMREDGIKSSIIRAGNDNLFRAPIFSETVATLLDHSIEIYDTTGAVGAARATLVEDRGLEYVRKAVLDNDYETTYHPLPNKEPYHKAYQNWKSTLKFHLHQ